MRLPELTHLEFLLLCQVKSQTLGTEIERRVKELGYEVNDIIFSFVMERLEKEGYLNSYLRVNEWNYLITKPGEGELERSFLFYERMR